MPELVGFLLRLKYYGSGVAHSEPDSGCVDQMGALEYLKIIVLSTLKIIFFNSFAAVVLYLT